MTPHFLFPSHPLRPAVVDPAFVDQVSAIRSAGFTVSLCADSALPGGKPLRNVRVGATVVYRGWMLDAREYGRLTDLIMDAGATPLTSSAEYLAAHHGPNWYDLLAHATPQTRVFPLTADFEAELRALGWGEFFIKDYVKSLKTSRGSIIRDPAEIDGFVAELKHFRGEIEGGLCVRRVEQFDVESERRYFVLNARAFAADGGAVPALVEDVASRIASPFFSVDVVRRADGALRVVEVGDGQVSDLVGWSPVAFAAIWNVRK